MSTNGGNSHFSNFMSMAVLPLYGLQPCPCRNFVLNLVYELHEGNAVLVLDIFGNQRLVKVKALLGAPFSC